MIKIFSPIDVITAIAEDMLKEASPEEYKRRLLEFFLRKEYNDNEE